MTLAWPPRVSTTGRLVTFQPGSPEDVRQAAELLLTTVQGERLAQPDYGRPDWALTRGGVDVETALSLLTEALPGTDPAVLSEVLEQGPDGWVERVVLGLTEGG